jgi:hypothetical protein
MNNIFRIALVTVLVAGLPLSAAGIKMQVYKTATCGCCAKWVEHLKANGFDVTVENVPSTAPYRAKYGVPEAMGSCHTGVVNGYSIEGHVPAREILRLVKSGAKAKGLAVPGMPTGSPGMEVGDRVDAYSVMLFDANGKTSVYQNYPAK